MQLDKKAKRILQDIMFFHMNQSDLNEVLSKNAPRDLPQHLAEGLPGDLRNWIRDVYSPAFTALQVAESLNVKDWVSRFTAKERAKILFFWQGDVSVYSLCTCMCPSNTHAIQKKGCLSQSVEYKILNKMAVREAMVQLYKVLTQFVSDGGPEWAEKFYAELQKSELGNTVVAVSSNDVSLNLFCACHPLSPRGGWKIMRMANLFCAANCSGKVLQHPLRLGPRNFLRQKIL